jgi:hypothetical protein
MKVKTPKPKEVVEDPAVIAQRQAAEKAAEEAATNAVASRLAKKTAVTARVFGGASAERVASSEAAKAIMPAPLATTFNSPPQSATPSTPNSLSQL